MKPGEGPAGRAKTGPNPTDRGRSGGKHCLLTDAEGVPLVVQTAAANEHDSTTLLPLVIDIPHVAGRVGRPKRKPDSLVADKAFDSEDLRTLLRWLKRYSAGGAAKRAYIAGATYFRMPLAVRLSTRTLAICEP